MEDSTVGSEAISVGWVVSFIASCLMNIYNWISLDKINSIMVFCATAVALVLTVYKLRGQITENKIKKRTLDKMEEEDERHA